MTLVLCGFLYLWMCKWRDRQLAAWIVFLGGGVTPFALTSLALLQCDPAFAGVREGNWPLVGVIVLILMSGVFWWAGRRRTAEQP